MQDYSLDILRLSLDIKTSTPGILYYYTGYAGYIVMGHNLKKYPEQIKSKWLLPAVIIALVAPVICKV